MSFRLNKWSVRWHIYRLARCCNIYVSFDVALKVAHKSLIITIIIMPFISFLLFSRVCLPLMVIRGHELIAGAVSCLGGIPYYITDSCVYIYTYIFVLFFHAFYLSNDEKNCWKSRWSPLGKVRWDAKAWEETVSNALALTWFLDYRRIVGIRASPSTLRHFRLKTHTFRCVQAFRPHSNALSVFIENASIWKRSWKWIKTKTHTYRISADGRKRIKMKKRWRHMYHVGCKISQVRVFVTCT